MAKDKQPALSEEVPAEQAGILQRLEAKMDQVLGDNKRLQQTVTELESWVKRMARQAKARA